MCFSIKIGYGRIGVMDEMQAMVIVFVCYLYRINSMVEGICNNLFMIH